MIQIRIHGRGGQGVVTAAELIAMAAFLDKKQAQAFPAFGVERTGAPIEAYARIDDQPIITREQIRQPDIIIVLDATLISTIDVAQGASADCKIIINTNKSKAEFKLNLPAENIFIVDATKIAMEIFGKNIINTVILGAFAKITELVSLNSLKKAVKEKFSDKSKELIEKNIKAITLAYES